MKIKFILSIALLSTMMTMVSCSQQNTNPGISSVDSGDLIGISISSENNVRELMKGETLQLSATVYPESTSQEVVWASSNETIATVSNGLVTALRKGNVTISASLVSNPDVKATYSIVVDATEQTFVAPESVKIDAIENPTCKVGTKLKLTAKVLPADAKQSLIWTTSNPKVATVSGGNVLGTGEGEVAITAKSRINETLVDQITVTVEKNDDPIYNGDFANMPYNTHDEVMSCEKDTRVKVKGVCVHADPINDKGQINYYIQNGTEGFYIYGQDASLSSVVVGDTYEVGGYKTVYAGMVEIKNIEHFVKLDESVEYVVNSLDGLNPMDSASMLKYQNSYVSGSATIEAVTTNTSAYNFTAKVNGYSTTFRVDPATMTDEEFTAISELLSGKTAGTNFKFKGIMNAFGWGKPTNQIKIVKASELEFSL